MAGIPSPARHRVRVGVPSGGYSRWERSQATAASDLDAVGANYVTLSEIVIPS